MTAPIVQTPGVRQVPTAFGGMPASIPNTVLGGEGFHVSHNDRDISIYGSETTALVKGQGSRFYILNGDHRKAYDELIGQGFDACLQYFKEHQALRNKRSDLLPD